MQKIQLLFVLDQHGDMVFSTVASQQKYEGSNPPSSQGFSVWSLHVLHLGTLVSSHSPEACT